MLNDDLITHLFNWFRFWVEKPISNYGPIKSSYMYWMLHGIP